MRLFVSTGFAVLLLASPVLAQGQLEQQSGIVPALSGEKPQLVPVVPLDLTHLDDRKLLDADGAPKLVALGDEVHADREPLVLVHGIDPSPGDLQALVDRFAKSTRYQLYLLAYDGKGRRTSRNGDGFAAELRALVAKLGPGRDLTIVAHSMGGIVTRAALDDLARGADTGLEKLGRVRFIAVDSPWSGYAGPGDHGFGHVEMAFAKVFLPKGLLDMRARSDFFQGLYDVKLPANVSVSLVFAKDGSQVSDYNEKPLTGLAAALVGLYARGDAVSGDPRVVSYWKALRDSDGFASLDAALRELAAKGSLDASSAKAALAASFPEFPGDHTGVLREHAGEKSLLDALVDRLQP